MNKICKYCNQQITELTAALKNGKLRNECKPCRSKVNVKYKQKTQEEKMVDCEICKVKCIKKFSKAFCSEVCRFMGYVEKGPERDSCWIWKGTIKRDGYGTFMFNGNKQYRAHRYSHELFKGKIDDGMIILHSCNQPLCVNPSHLRQGTHKENGEDMVKYDRQAKGEKCARSKLNDFIVKEIRALHDNGASKEEIANKFDATIGNIYWIVTGKTWKHI